MATSSPNQTPYVDILAHQSVVHPTTVIGSGVNCTGKRGVTLFLYHGYVEAAGDVNFGKFIVQVRPNAGDSNVQEDWVDLVPLPAKGTTPDTEAMTATEPVGETVLACASTSGFAVEDEIYIQNAAVVASGEWNKLRSIQTNTSLTMVNGITNPQDATSIIWNDASKYIVKMELESIQSFRVIWTHEGATGANGHIKGLASFWDSDNIG